MLHPTEIEQNENLQDLQRSIDLVKKELYLAQLNLIRNCLESALTYERIVDEKQEILRRLVKSRRVLFANRWWRPKN